MKPSRPASNRRWLLWAPLLAVAAWLAFFGDKSPTSGAAVSLPTRPAPADIALPTRAPTAETVKPETPKADVLAALVPRERLIPQGQAAAADSGKAARDPFSARNWNPPPPPPTIAPQPAAAPTAPPLPYAFIGKKQEGETWEVYLTRGEQAFVAREGEVLEGNYRVDRIQPPTLTLTYLPLGEVQSLSIGDTR